MKRMCSLLLCLALILGTAPAVLQTSAKVVGRRLSAASTETAALLRRDKTGAPDSGLPAPAFLKSWPAALQPVGQIAGKCRAGCVLNKKCL